MFPDYTSLGTLTVGGNPPALIQESNVGSANPQCGPLPGTILRIFIPAGAVVNLLNLIELNSPSGICLIVRLPFLGSGSGGTNVQSIINAVQSAGGRVEVSQ
jgi:hypothetical protein